MSDRNFSKLTGPNVWVGPDIQNSSNWIHILSQEAIKDLDKALNSVLNKNLSIPFEKEDFSAPIAVSELKKIMLDVCDGVGFSIIRGIPRDKYTDEECEIIYWGIGVHIGQPVSQNARGHLLGHVIDEGRDKGF